VTGSAATGADPATVGSWLAARTSNEAWRECRIELIAGGKSNLTYLVSAAEHSVILRRPPTGHILPTAHDMLREARVIGALGPTGFPVPGIIAVERTGQLLGQPFYVMQRVAGHIVRDAFPAGYAQSADDHAQVASRLVSTLAELHRTDYTAAGLADFGRPEGYLDRQVRRWTKQSVASTDVPVPGLAELGDELVAALPNQPEATIVHGDFRLDNCVLDPSDPGRIAAVLDWEMSTLGDPLADLGVLLVYWAQSADQVAEALQHIIPKITQQAGFPDRAGVAELYAQATGRNVGALPFYVAFGYFKLAVVIQGIVARQLAGAMGGQDFGPMGDLVGALADRGRSCLADQTLG